MERWILYPLYYQESPKDFFFFFDVDHFKSICWICCNIAFILGFFFFFFGSETRGILASGVELAPPALEGKVLTTGLPREPPD